MTKKEHVAHYEMLYTAYFLLTKLEEITLAWPGELSASEIDELRRLKASFHTGLVNSERMGLPEFVKAQMKLQKKYTKLREALT